MSIVIIEDDPLALNYETMFLKSLQNYNGFHLSVWGTVKLDKGIEKCTHDAHLADIVILELSLLDITNRNISREIKKPRPDVIIIGITSHTEKYPRSTVKSLQLYDIVNKHKLNCELPYVIERIYREKTPPRRSNSSHDEGASSPPAHSNVGIRNQLPGSDRNPYCQDSTKHHNRASDTSNVSGKAESPAAVTQQRQNLTSTPRKRNRSQRSEIPLRNDNTRKHSGKLSESKPTSHDLAAAQRKMSHSNRPNLPTASLTRTELKVVDFSTRGMKPIEIADELGIEVDTIYSHRNHIKGKYHTHSWHEVLTIYGEQKKNGTL
ncbi:MAG: DNA-binding response regulator [Bifidobacterium sp.]|nr:DNA-binding response regulator [Bifidobacterium sp.]